MLVFYLNSDSISQMKDFTFKEYGIGTLAYYDAFIAGIVPCKVISIKPNEVAAMVTKQTGAYNKGDIVYSFRTNGASMIFPRERLFYRGIYKRINTQFAWKVEK